MKKLILSAAAILSITSLVGCSHSEDDVKTRVSKVVRVYYDAIVLDWDAGTFTHGEYTIAIPDKWGFGVWGQKERFKEYDPHDIEYAYTLETRTTYGGSVSSVASFEELVYKKPDEASRIFEINTVGVDIDSKLFVKDELVNDCYFKYDVNHDFYNFCYFKIAKNDVNQLKEGYFNQINVKLKYYKHVDSSHSFMVAEEKDGLNNVGYYCEVSISHNPDLVC